MTDVEPYLFLPVSLDDMGTYTVKILGKSLFPTVDIPIGLHFNDWIHRNDLTLAQLLNLIESEEENSATNV